MAKGFLLSLEAVLALLLISGILIMEIPAEKKDLHALLVFQKENDLLKIWAKQRRFSLEEMQKDFEFAFQGANGEITFNGKSMLIGKRGNNAIASEAVFFDSGLQRTVISVKVFE